jgi:hypothetical protein
MGITGIMSITGIIIRSPEVIIPILRITGATEVASAGGPAPFGAAPPSETPRPLSSLEFQWDRR